MPPIGETLREARLRQKIDITEVESATKIRAKYIRALENEEFGRLPGTTFVRTFLRTYADYLGLDAHLLVEEYRVSHEPPVEDDVQQFAPSPASPGRPDSGYRERSGGRGGPGRGAILAGVALGVLLLFLVIGLVTGDDGESPGDAAPVATEGGGGRSGPSGDDRKPRGGSSGGGDGELALRVTPVDATYVCVDDGDGRRLFEGTLASSRTFRADTLRLNLGRSSARVELDGERVNVPESTTGVGYEFTPRGEKELPVGERPCT